MKHVSFAVLLSLLFLIVPRLGKAQASEERPGSRRHVGGTVYYADSGDPASNILVELRSSEGLVIQHQMTGDTGRFEFSELQRGSYQLTINSIDYEPVDELVDLSFTSENGVVLNLKRRDADKRSEPGSAVSAHILSLPEKARNAYDSGRKKYKAKDTKGSIEDFQKAIKTAPKFYEAYENMGLAYLQLNKTDEAEKAFRKSIEVSGDKFAPADVDLSSMIMDHRDFAGGERMARHGLELAPNYWLGHYELGRALIFENHVADALKSAETAAKLQPGFAPVYRLLAIIHVRQHNNTALLQDLDQYIKLDPDSPAGRRAKQLRDQLQPTAAKQAGPVSKTQLRAN